MKAGKNRYIMMTGSKVKNSIVLAQKEFFIWDP